MARIPARCPRCGLVDVGYMFDGSGPVTFTSSRASCPKCGALATIVDGTYSLGDKFLRAINQPGVTLQKLEAFHANVIATKSGNLSAEKALMDTYEINSSFGEIFRIALNNKELIRIVLELLTFFILIYTLLDSNEDSERLHNDARAQIEATSKQTQAIQSVGQAILSAQSESQKIAEARRQIDLKIAELNALSQSSVSPPPPKEDRMQRIPSKTKNKPANRHERRKAASLAKRNPS